MAELRRLIESEPESPEAIFRELLGCRVSLEIADGPDALKTDSVRPICFEGPNGDKGLAAFTDAEAVKVWKAAGGMFAEMGGQDVCRIAVTAKLDFLVLNPGGASWVVPREDLEVLAEGRVPNSEDSVEIQFYPLERRLGPDGLSWFAQALGPFPEISACYLFSIGVGKAEPRLALKLVLDLPEDARDAFVDRLVNEVQAPEAFAGIPWGVLPVAPTPEREQAGQVVFRRTP